MTYEYNKDIRQYNKSRKPMVPEVELPNWMRKKKL